MENNLFSITLNYEGQDILVENVDIETANLLLNDAEAARNYVEQMFALETDCTTAENGSSDVEDDDSSAVPTSSASTPSPSLTVWCTKRPTDRDLEATYKFLQLRAKYACQFDDKKHTKAQMWGRIANEMASLGYSVGNGKEALEKLRQKFANLQRQYLQHRRNINRTGEEKKEPPPFYSEMHDLLGQKDKCAPKGLQDSLSDKVTDISEQEENCSEAAGTSTYVNVKNRFSAKKRLRPDTANCQLMNMFKQQHEEDREDRKHQFQVLENLMKTQNDQRERLLHQFDQLIKMNKQRRVDSDSD